MDILLLILFVTLAVLSSWFAHTRVTNFILHHVIDAVTLAFIFQATGKVFPAFLSDKPDTSPQDLALIMVCVLVWGLMKRPFEKARRA